MRQRDYVGEFLARRVPTELIGNEVEGTNVLVLAEDEMGELKDHLLHQDRDPAPDLSDEELLERYQEARKESESGS